MVEERRRRQARDLFDDVSHERARPIAHRLHVAEQHRRMVGRYAGVLQDHVTHILDKLGTANRTEAAARPRELGLLP